MKTIATICARGGSVGLPKKNILPLGNKPLLAHTIEQALNCKSIHDVYVSTDCPEIAEIARQYGASVPFIRPDHLASSTAGKIPVIQHCLEFLTNAGEKISKVVDLQPTSPLRKVEDIEACINLLTSDIDNVFSVYETDKNPYFTLVEENSEGGFQLSKKLDQEIFTRQAAPAVYALNGSIYVWHAHSLYKGLWEGKSRCHIMPKNRSIDIDDEIDFELARVIYERGMC